MKTDDELIEGYEAGDESAFSELLDRYLDAVYSFALRLTGSKDDAEDVSQETFLKAWKSLKRFRKGANFKTWLFAIARNASIDSLRKKKPALFGQLSWADGEEFEHGIADNAPSADVLLDRDFSKGRLDEALANIAPIYREILLLHYHEDMTLEEAALTLDIPLNTAKSRDRRALIALRKLLEPERA